MAFYNKSEFRIPRLLYPYPNLDSSLIWGINIHVRLEVDTKYIWIKYSDYIYISNVKRVCWLKRMDWLTSQSIIKSPSKPSSHFQINKGTATRMSNLSIIKKPIKTMTTISRHFQINLLVCIWTEVSLSSLFVTCDKERK